MMELKPCPLKLYCLPHLNDETIVGCTVPEYTAGKVRRQEVVVWHRIKEDKNDPGRSNQTRRGKS